MIGVLLGINVLLATQVILTTSMLLNHFKIIEKGTKLYLNQKVYASHRRIKFIKGLLDRYEEVEEGSTIDVEHMVKAYFYEQKIGKFSYLGVQSIATKGKYMMWGILVSQIIVEVLGKNPGTSKLNFVFIIISAIQCLLFTLSNVVINIQDKREALLVKLSDYILHSYPIKKKSLEKQEVKNFMDALDIKIGEKNATDHEVEIPVNLNEEDIRYLIQQFDKNA